MGPCFFRCLGVGWRRVALAARSCGRISHFSLEVPRTDRNPWHPRHHHRCLARSHASACSFPSPPFLCAGSLCLAPLLSLLFPCPRARDQLPPHPRSRRYSGDSDSSASSAQSGPLGARSEDLGTGPRRERPSRRVTTGTPASPRRPPAPRSQSRDRLDRGRPRGAPGGRGGQLSAPSPARRARSQSREEQTVLLVRRDRDGQHSWVPRGRGSGGSGRSSPRTPRARSPAAPRVPSPSPELSTIPASEERSLGQPSPSQS